MPLPATSCVCVCVDMNCVSFILRPVFQLCVCAIIMLSTTLTIIDVYISIQAESYCHNYSVVP